MFGIEDVLATLFTGILIFVFIFSVIGVYSNYLEKTSFLEQKRLASSISENIFFSNDGVAESGEMNFSSAKVIIGNASFSENSKNLVKSSLPLLVNGEAGGVFVYVWTS